MDLYLQKGLRTWMLAFRDRVVLWTSLSVYPYWFVISPLIVRT
jgi:hypothetical protein